MVSQTLHRAEGLEIYSVVRSFVHFGSNPLDPVASRLKLFHSGSSEGLLQDGTDASTT